MSKIMQNLVVFMEPSEYAHHISLKAGNMILNRFCIDEEAAFEFSGVSYFNKWYREFEYEKRLEFEEEMKLKVQRKEKGKEYSFLRFFYILENLMFMNN